MRWSVWGVLRECGVLAGCLRAAGAEATRRLRRRVAGVEAVCRRAALDEVQKGSAISSEATAIPGTMPRGPLLCCHLRDSHGDQLIQESGRTRAYRLSGVLLLVTNART